MDNNKNFLLAMVLSLVVLGGWEFFIAKPQQLQANHAAQVLLAQQEKKEPLAKMAAPHANVAAAHLDRTAALKLAGPRVPIDTPTLDGSLLLKGARFDDLRLKQYRETLDPKSPEIVLLAPSATSFPYFALFGWQPMPGSNVAVPGDTSEWKLVRGTTLTPNSPDHASMGQWPRPRLHAHDLRRCPIHVHGRRPGHQQRRGQSHALSLRLRCARRRADRDALLGGA